jgi:hypothetical protein
VPGIYVPRQCPRFTKPEPSLSRFQVELAAPSHPDLRQNANLLKSIKAILAVQSLAQKDFSSVRSQITSVSAAVPRP